MGLRQRIIRAIAGDLIESEIREGIKRAKMALPITANYDPKGEGYRPLMGGVSQQRDLISITQGRMFEIAYYMWDNSMMTRGMATMDKAFLFSEPLTITAGTDDAQEVIDNFLEINEMELRFPTRMMWLSLLGEQLWPVEVNPLDGEVLVSYRDPAEIREIWINAQRREQVLQVELKARQGSARGVKYKVIRRDTVPASKSFGRLWGNCFFLTINKPENAQRGRSDYLTLFDWIDGLERYGFNCLERGELIDNFIWDVTLKGMSEDQIREWLQGQRPPDAGSLRAHNENVEWEAVAPDLKAHDRRAGFDMGKSFIMGAARRPESWFGGGGKAYQTEADQFNQVPIKDFEERQLYCKFVMRQVIAFVLDQALLAKKLTIKDIEAGFTVDMPEISRKDLTKLVNGVPQLTTALSVASQERWVSQETAARIFGSVIGQLGFQIDVDKELKKVGTKPVEDGDGVDYDKIANEEEGND